MPHNMPQKENIKDCIDNCRECSDICLEAIQYCLEKGGKHLEKNHLTLLQVCAQICHTSAYTMLLGSKNHPTTCKACAEICADCADSCDNFSNDEFMKSCAEWCRKCALSCHEMAETLKENSGGSPTPSAHI